MSAAAIAAAFGFSEQETLDLFGVYISLHEVNSRITFEEALADPAIRICLKNTAHARRQALARRRKQSANDASQFQLTP